MPPKYSPAHLGAQYPMPNGWLDRGTCSRLTATRRRRGQIDEHLRRWQTSLRRTLAISRIQAILSSAWSSLCKQKQLVNARPPVTLKSSFLLLMVAAILVGPFKVTLGSALAADFCVELTATEFNHQAERRGDYNACARGRRPSIEAIARERARSNATNAIASHCLKNVTPSIQQHACSRVNSASTTLGNALWAAAPPTPKPAARKVQYIGQGGGALRPDARPANQNSQFC